MRVQIEGAVIVKTVLNALDCPACGVVFAVTEDHERHRRADGESFYCPNGHSLSYGNSEADKLRNELERTKRDRQAAYDYADSLNVELAAERRSHATTKGNLTKTLKRVHAGVCPHCHRTFSQLARHMAAKHHAEPDPA